MKKIIVYNPYSILSFYTLFLNYSVLKSTFGKAELLRKMLPESLYFYLKKKSTRKYTQTFNQKDISIFKHVEIETINRCNNSCSFCPVNKKQDIRILKKMDDETFFKIINQLSDINYSGDIAFHSNNEPLLDSDLAKKIKYAHEKCPKAYLYFYTNGILLTKELVIEFKKSGVQKIVINNYNNRKKLNTNTKLLIQELKKLDCPQITVIIRNPNQVLTNRGGNSPNKPVKKFNQYKHFQNLPCSLPFEELIIGSDGKVKICGQDAYGEVILGDTNINSLMEIWHGESFSRIKKKLLNSGRQGVALCKVCDA